MSEEIIEIEVQCIVRNNRLLQIYRDGEIQEAFCIHGTILRWSCHDCEFILGDEDEDEDEDEGAK